MNAIRNAFHSFFSSFTVNDFRYPGMTTLPAYQAGYVFTRDMQGKPVPPTPPYLTYEIVRPGFLDFTIITANVYDRDPQRPGFLALVDDVLAQAAKKVPEGGTLLDIGEEGALWLLRGSPFVTYMPDNAPADEDPVVVRGLIRIAVKDYVL